MRRKTVIRIGAAALLLAAGGAAAAYPLRARPNPVAAEYPDCPFHPVGPDFPRLIAVEDEPPREQKEAYAKYREGRAAVRKFMLEEGAMSRETPEAREAYRVA